MLLVACGRDGADGDSEAAKRNATAVEVTVVTITPRTVPVTFTAVGQTEGSREVEVRSRVGGILLRRHYSEGEFVKRGTLLFKIDPAPYEATQKRLQGELAQAQAQLEKARRDAARLEPLFAENAVSRKEFEDAVSARETAAAAVQSARAAVAEARLNLDYTRVEAPINGITGRAEKSEGSLIAAGTDLLTRMSQVDPIYANFSYSENELLRVRDQIAADRLVLPPDNEFRVELTLADGGTYPHTGRLNFNDFRVQRGTGTIAARAVFPNPKKVLLPGQFVRVTLHGATRLDAILIPQGAALSNSKGKFVYVVNDAGAVEQRQVETSEWIDQQFLVTSGLKPGERVVVGGAMKVKPGMPVKVLEIDAQGAPRATPPPGLSRDRDR